MNIKKLKEWLMQAYLDASNQKYLSLNSDIAIKAYENNLFQRQCEIYEFDNVDLIALCAFNRFNSGLRGNPVLWRQGMKYVAQNSTSVNSEIDVLQINQIQSLLLDYLHEGRLAINDFANNKIINDIKIQNKKSTTLQAIRTIHDFSKLVASLPDPSVDGFTSVLRELAEIERKNQSNNIFKSCHSMLMQVEGFGVALSMNMTKDTLLLANNNMSINELKTSVIGQLTKADIWTKRILALYVNQEELLHIKSYSEISEKQSEELLLSYKKNNKSWEGNFHQLMNDVCHHYKSCPLELDRLIYSIFSRRFSDGQETYRLPELSVAHLKSIWN